MKESRILWVLFVVMALFFSFTKTGLAKNETYGIVIHGGAGTILKKNLTLQEESAFQLMLAK